MNNFNELINSDELTLVDFFANWCEPCKAMAPVLKNVAEKTKGKARIIKVDVDRNPSVSPRFDIRSIPTLILFKKGEIKWRQVGTASEELLLQVISQFAS